MIKETKLMSVITDCISTMGTVSVIIYSLIHPFPFFDFFLKIKTSKSEEREEN